MFQIYFSSNPVGLCMYFSVKLGILVGEELVWEVSVVS